MILLCELLCIPRRYHRVIGVLSRLVSFSSSSAVISSGERSGTTASIRSVKSPSGCIAESPDQAVGSKWAVTALIDASRSERIVRLPIPVGFPINDKDQNSVLNNKLLDGDNDSFVVEIIYSVNAITLILP